MATVGNFGAAGFGAQVPGQGGPQGAHHHHHHHKAGETSSPNQVAGLPQEAAGGVAPENIAQNALGGF